MKIDATIFKKKFPKFNITLKGSYTMINKSRNRLIYNCIKKTKTYRNKHN